MNRLAYLAVAIVAVFSVVSDAAATGAASAGNDSVTDTSDDLIPVYHEVIKSQSYETQYDKGGTKDSYDIKRWNTTYNRLVHVLSQIYSTNYFDLTRSSMRDFLQKTVYKSRGDSFGKE